MQYFPPFGSHPLVPSYFSLIKIDFANVTQGIRFVFPAAFPTYTPENQPLAGVIILSNTSALAPSNLYLPDATLGAVGNECLIINDTSSDIPIYDFGENQIAFIGSGASSTLILKTNSDANGEWVSVASGVVSPVDPTILAGGGLAAYANKLNVVTFVTDYATLPASFTVNQDNSLFNYTGSTASWTLPTVPYTGFAFYLKNSTTVNGILTVNPQGGSTIDGLTEINLLADESVFLISSGSNWFTVGRTGLGTSGAQLTSNGILVGNGTVGSPSFSFINYSNTGFYTLGTSDISVSSNGNNIAAFTQLAFNSNLPIQIDGIDIFYLRDIYP